MGSMEGFRGGDYGQEVSRDPEVDKLLDFFEAYRKVQEIMAWLVEASPAADPMVVSVRRGLLQRLLSQLGIDPQSPDSLAQLEVIKMNLADRTRHPEPRVEVPDEAFFRDRIRGVTSEYEQLGAPSTVGYAQQGVTDIVGVAQFGHTDWRDVQTRGDRGSQTSRWIRGVACIMADPIAYQTEFAGLGIDPARRTADPVTIGEDWSIQNGRHRSLAAVCLGETYVEQAGMSQWIDVVVEQPA